MFGGNVPLFFIYIFFEHYTDIGRRISLDAVGMKWACCLFSESLNGF
jgi:hypothetical protein